MAQFAMRMQVEVLGLDTEYRIVAAVKEVNELMGNGCDLLAAVLEVSDKWMVTTEKIQAEFQRRLRLHMISRRKETS